MGGATHFVGFEQANMEGARGFAEGLTNLWTSAVIYGQAPALDVTQVEVQPQPSTVLPSSAGTLSVVSDSALDAFGVGGCEAVLIQGLDADYTNTTTDPTVPYYQAIVLMNGLTPVPVPVQLLRQNTMLVVLGSPIGTITSDIDGLDQLVLRPGEAFPKSARTVTPHNQASYTTRVVPVWSAAQDVELSCFATGPDGTVEAELVLEISSAISELNVGVFSFPPSSDIRCFARRVGGGSTDNFVAILPTVKRRHER